MDSGSEIGYCTSLAVDDNGYAHISYTEDAASLKYAYQDTAGWHTQVVESAGAFITSIALDNSGHPHIAYISGDYLKYASLEGSEWNFQKVDKKGFVGSNNSIALDADGFPHISYSDVWSKQLKYAWRSASGWHYQVVDNVTLYKTSLGLDANGFAHISYNDRYDLKYAYQDATGWYTETVDTAWEVAGNSLRLDSAGLPHIVYVGEGVTYAYKDASGWHKQMIDGTTNGVSMALDSAGYAHVSYVRGALTYAYQDASGWHTQTVDTYPYISDSTSIAVDNGGRPHIAYTYYDCPDRACDLTQLNHTFWDGSNWQIEKVDISAAYPGSYLSIAMDNAGYPRIAHSGGFLDYVYKDSTGWHSQTIDSTGGYHSDSSLALDKCGSAHISYWNEQAGELKLAYQGSACNFLLPVTFNAYQYTPRLQLHLDEPAGATTFSNSSGWGNNASCSAPGCPTAGVASIQGTALQFDGINDFLTLGNPSSLNFTGKISLEAWVRIQSTTGIQNIIAHGYTTNPDREVFLRLQDGLYKVGSWDGIGYNAYSHPDR